MDRPLTGKCALVTGGSACAHTLIWQRFIQGRRAAPLSDHVIALGQLLLQVRDLL